MAQSGLTRLFHDALLGIMPAGRMITRASVQRIQERVYGVHQIFPGDLDGFLELRELQVIGFFQFHNPPLELRKARPDIFQFLVVLELHADLLLCESPF